MTYTRPKMVHELTPEETADRAKHWTAGEDELRAYIEQLEERLAAAENRCTALSARVGTLELMIRQARNS